MCRAKGVTNRAMNRPEGEGLDGERLARFISGECTEEERAGIQAWMDADPTRRELVASLAEVWEVTGQGGKSWDVDQAWEEFVAKRSARAPAARPAPARGTGAMAFPRRRLPTWAIRAAAALVLVAGGAAVWSQLGGPGQVADSLEAREYATGHGERAEIELPDGTLVTLAPRSHLRVAAAYGGDRREVLLAGQGVFQVTHDPQRPFQVRSEGVVTEVLGTRFVVRAYADDPDVSVALAEGSVRLRRADDDEATTSLTLRPGEVARAAAGEAARLDGDASLAPFLAWAEGQLIFEDTPLAEAARELGRWYDVDVRLEDPSLASRQLTATFQSEPIAQVLDLITFSLDLRYERDGRDIVLSPR